ncbi:MAG: MoxR family ATPase [Oligoflexia bacterium]|nr:MoxR family ATPase [Oligoflexia bacterium]
MGKEAVFDLVGREQELRRVRACLAAGRNVLLEGPVGVGKTHLALAVTRELKSRVFRIDGDSRYTEQKLSGWFDPPTAVKKGFGKASFIPGPLAEAMTAGGILFINELNRLPEGVQNVLLPAIDEGMLVVPRLGMIRARSGFLVIATQNPKEFVATSHLSEAILDRFELVALDYQTEAEELRIVSDRLGAIGGSLKGNDRILALASVRLARRTREQPRIRRGASIRAAIAIAELAQALIKDGLALVEAFVTAALMALPTRIEIEREAESDRSPRAEVERLVEDWARAILQELNRTEVKKKP